MIDPWIAVGGAAVGFVVGLTGMGGGALMTPMLVLGFDIRPLTAVSSDLVAAAVMKPVGGAVHAKSGTVILPLVLWLVIGSVPSAFGVVALVNWLAPEARLDDIIELAIGVALVLASVGLMSKGALRARPEVDEDSSDEIVVHRGRTLAIGVFGGLMVGLTSVGSGSLMMVLLLLLYPAMSAARLVGTDLVQATPLVASAALAHMLFGDVDYWLTASLLIGAVPAVLAGARISATAPDRLIRPLLAVVLLATGTKLLGAPTPAVATVVLILLALYAALQYHHHRLEQAAGQA